MIERESIKKKTGESSREIAQGITSQSPNEASAQEVLAINRGHWSIESTPYIIDWNFHEDRSRIRTGHGPVNITRLRRFAVGILKSFQTTESIAEMMRKLCFSTRRVFDYLRMTKNSAPEPRSLENRFTVPPVGAVLRANEKSRHRLGARVVVCARSVLGGLHHEYSLTPGLA